MSDQKQCVCMGAGPALSQILTKLGPGEEAAEHFRGARVEFLKGIRALIDKQLESLAKPESKGSKVTVE
ncbi:MAG: hypothetical protein NTV70_13395 [Acidobacteria bacterium]|nr:hypothetical protein [Acidobacteriota bacterium]